MRQGTEHASAPRAGPPQRVRRARSSAAAALSLALVLLSASRAEAHMPPPIYAAIKVTDRKVTFRLIASFPIFREWFGVDPLAMPTEASADLPGDTREKVALGMARWLHVEIDRVPVSGTVESVLKDVYSHEGLDWKFINVAISFETKGPAKEVSFTWTQYEQPFGALFDGIQSELDAPGQKTSYQTFKEKEPEYIWHRPLEPPPPVALELPKPAPPPTIPVPLVSLALVLLGAAALLWTRRRGVARGARLAGAAAVLVGAVALHGVARADIPVPWARRYERPPDARALYVFEGLLRNVYRAFDFDTENEIYDTLSRSVSGRLLERIYLEVHRSLIMQDQGGAVCKIESVRLLDQKILSQPDPDAPYFKVNARWEVVGKVSHHYHTHQRVIEYVADFTVSLEPDGWKIAALDVKDQTRTDDGRTVR